MELDLRKKIIKRKKKDHTAQRVMKKERQVCIIEPLQKTAPIF